MTLLYIDLESRATVDLPKRGSHVYWADPHADVLMACYAFDDGPVHSWTRGEPAPPEVVEHIRSGGMISGWNVFGFERLAFNAVLGPRYGWPVPAREQYTDTMHMAAAMALPRSLEKAAEALGLPVQKDREGKRLINKFSKPRRARKGEDPDAIHWNAPEDHREDFERFVEYCRQDVEVERAARKRMVPLSESEQRLAVLDSKINDRGLRIDVRSARAAINLAEKAKKHLDREMRLATGGYVTACSQPGKLVAWADDQGVAMESAAKADIEALLERDDLPENVRRALDLRLEAAKTSVSKLNAMLARANDDGRVRGSYIYHAASTGRFQSTGVNMANLPRPRGAFEGLRQDVVFDAIRSEDPAVLQYLYGPELGRPLHLLSDAIRGFIWAAPGHELVQADYSGIEGAVIAWLAQEDWKLAAMHEIIADPKLPDMYRRTAASILNLPVETVTKKHWARQAVGKVSELACIAEGELVLTEIGLIPIQNVPTYVRVWDGVEWVTHDGPVFRGFRKVIEYDGLTATPDHVVFTRDGEQTTFGACADEQIPLAKTGSGGEAVRVGGCDKPGSRLDRPVRQTAEVSASPLYRLWGREVDRHGELAEGQDEGVPGLLATAARSEVAGPAGYGGEGSLRESEGSRLPTLRRERDRISIPLCSCGRCVSFGERQRPTRLGVRPDRQQRSLRAGERPLRPATEEPAESQDHVLCSHCRVVCSGERRLPSVPPPAPKGAVCGPHAKQVPVPRYERSGNCRALAQTVVQTERPVWDLLNAGPRNRFTVSGRLVHNCGYAGGVSAFYAMARGYNVDLDALYPNVWEQAEEEHRERATRRYENELKRGKSKTDVLSREAWIACEIIKLGWRAANPAIAQSWRALETAAREAVANPGTVTEAARCRYVTRLGFLWCQLPSGRCLAYGSPRLKDQVWAKVRLEDGAWSDAEVMERESAEALERKGRVKIEGTTSAKVTALSVDSVTKKWRRFALYGGLAAENVTQAVARDLLVNGMWKAEEAGYPIVGTVYDEIITEVPRGFGDLGAFERLICELPDWAEGLPLTAGGWRGKRYRKD